MLFRIIIFAVDPVISMLLPCVVQISRSYACTKYGNALEFVVLDFLWFKMLFGFQITIGLHLKIMYFHVVHATLGSFYFILACYSFRKEFCWMFLISDISVSLF